MNDLVSDDESPDFPDLTPEQRRQARAERMAKRAAQHALLLKQHDGDAPAVLPSYLDLLTRNMSEINASCLTVAQKLVERRQRLKRIQVPI